MKINKTHTILVAVLFGQLILSACTQKNRNPGSTKESLAQKTVRLAIWSNYLPVKLIESFEKNSGIHVQISNYSSNEELLAKLQTGTSEYDVVVPSDYMVFAMIKLGLIRELDYSQLSNSKYLDSKFLKKAFDSQNKFSVPYDWGTTGIAINHALYPGTIRSWKELFGKADLSGKFSLLDDSREVIGAALKSEGYSMNSVRRGELDKAKQVLLNARERVKVFTSEPFMPLVNGEIAVAQIYMSDALQARKKLGSQIEYRVPEEGGTFWIDNLVIPSRSNHIQEAHAFINFLLEPNSNAETVKSVWVAPANHEALKLLPQEVQADLQLFPSAATVLKCEMIQDLGEAGIVWDQIWTEVKAQH